jgi:hypothetical protein
MKKHKSKNKKHDRKTCFRCRLHELFVELYPNGAQDDVNFILASIAEMAGAFLSVQKEKDLRTFMTSVLHNIMEYRSDMREDKPPTKH